MAHLADLGPMLLAMPWQISLLAGFPACIPWRMGCVHFMWLGFRPLPVIRWCTGGVRFMCLGFRQP